MNASARYLFVLLLLTMSASGAAQSLAPIDNNYSISGFRDDVFLVSAADCSSALGLTRCQLQYSITIKTLDVAIGVTWKTPNGDTFASLSNTWDYWFNYDQKDNYSNQTLIVGRSFNYAGNAALQVRTETGKATVSGHRFASGNVPNCVNSFTCDAPYYVLRNQTGPSPTLRASGLTALAAAEPPAVPVATSTRLSLRAYLFGNLDDTQNAIDKPLIEYRSSVAASTGEFVFDYAVENLGVIDQQFDWSEVGLAGTLAPGATVHSTLRSALAPGLVSNQAALALETATLIPLAIDVLAPVPEPSSAAMLIAGIAALVLCMRRRSCPLAQSGQ